MTVPSRAFGRDARLSERDDFSRVFSEGRRISGRGLILWYRAGPEQRPARLGLSVGAKVGAAVRRNRLKRLTREAFRHNRERLEAGLDLVACLRPGCRWKGLDEAADELLALCAKAGLLRK